MQEMRLFLFENNIFSNKQNKLDWTTLFNLNLGNLCTEREKTENEITQRLLGSLFGAKDERHFPNF